MDDNDGKIIPLHPGQESPPKPAIIEEANDRYILRCASQRDPDTGLWCLPSQSVDHVITDPPYDAKTHNNQRSGSQLMRVDNGKISISKSRDLGFRHLTLEEMKEDAKQFKRLARRWVIVCCSPFQISDWDEAAYRAGLETVRVGCWNKTNPTPQFSGDRPGTGWEAIMIFHQPGKKTWNGGGKDAVWDVPEEHVEGCPECGYNVPREGEPVWTYAIPQGKDRFHTTQKPLGLFEALILDFTDPNEVILDPFSGSGTTGAAALRYGRRYVGYEIQHKYYERSKKRLDEVREQRTFHLVPPSEQEGATYEQSENRGEEAAERSPQPVAGSRAAEDVPGPSGKGKAGRQLSLLGGE